MRSSRPEVFFKKAVLRNYAKFTGKHLCQRLWCMCFPVNFVKFPRAPIFTEHLRWLLLNNQQIFRFHSLNISLKDKIRHKFETQIL